MDQLRAAAQHALESLRGYRREMQEHQPCDAEVALAAALEQPEQDQFCDSHCTWLDHHPECVRAKQERNA